MYYLFLKKNPRIVRRALQSAHGDEETQSIPTHQHGSFNEEFLSQLAQTEP
jgi:hypothetical protein